MKKRSIVITFILSAILGLTRAHFLLAESPPSRVGISVDQSVVSFDGNPGEAQTFSLNIRNIFSQSEIINLEAEDVILGDNNQEESTSIFEEAKGLKAWIKADNTSLKLAPGESRQIFLTVTIPYDAVVGSHTGAVMVRAYPEITGENFQQVIVSGRVGVYVLINVKGEVSGKGSIGYFGAPLFSGKKATIQVDYQNQGNIHYVPHGEIRTQNVITRETDTLSVDKHFVFPGKKYSFMEEWNVPSILGVYKVQAAFVDGDGQEHSNQKYVIGSLFLPMLTAVIIIIGLTIKLVLKSKKPLQKPKKVL
jgi:hypothetical protein